MSKRVTLASGGINWTWYIVALLDGSHCTVELYDRLHNDRDRLKQPKTDGAGTLLQSQGDRIVYALEIHNGECKGLYTVDNPQHVFSYPAFND